MSRFDGKVAVVTGSAQGIGAATALRLASEGAAVAVFDVTEDRCVNTVQAITRQGGRAIGMGCDVSDNAQVEAGVQRVVEEFGGLHVLINNAGVTRDNLLFKMTEDDWDLCLGVSLKGTFLMVRAAQKHMVEQRYGKVVNFSSTSAKGNRGQANYSAAKAGLQGLTATLAAELGPFNINVNAVAPGYVATPMTAATAARIGMSTDQMEEDRAKATPLRRVAQPEDIASVVAFFASEDARHVSGQTLYVNGGLN